MPTPSAKFLTRAGLLGVLFACTSAPHGVAEELPALDCVINPHKVFDLGSSVRGVLDAVHVERSDYVEAGDVIAELDADVERAAIAVAEARAEITSEILLSQLNYEFDTRRKERISNLFANDSVSIQNKEDAELAAELSAQRLQEASERDRIRELELWRARELLEQKVIRTPGSGFVLKKFKSPGEYVEDQPVVRIAQLDRLNVEVIAPMDLFGKIQVGMTAVVYPEITNGAPRTAEVTLVDPMGDVASGTFGVRLNLPNADYTTPAGVKCQLQFEAAPTENQTAGASHLAARAVSKAARTAAVIESGADWAVIQTEPLPAMGRGDPLAEPAPR